MEDFAIAALVIEIRERRSEGESTERLLVWLESLRAICPEEEMEDKLLDLMDRVSHTTHPDAYL